MLFMSKTSRTKGATFERDIVKRLNEFFESHDINFSCKRNLDQYQKPVRVCLPLYAISAEYAQDNDLTCVVDFETWIAILEKRWDSYDIDLNWPV